jgi:uncharacterized membrane protein YidH (DUF202 family)
MAEDMTGDPRVSLAETRTDLAAMRTRYAAERTLMAWIRTAISMIGFGFSIYKFFQYLVVLPDVSKRYHAQAPRNLGLALIALGTLALAAAIIEHVGLIRGLSDNCRVRISLVLIVAVLMVFVGLLAFIGILTKTGPF